MVEAVGQQNWIALRRRARRLDASALRDLSPLLVLSPHQDDETLGCGGLIAAAAEAGLRPRVAYLTDGAASHTGSAAWPASRLARARRQEALNALQVLGVGAEDVLFLGWPDASPFGLDSQAYRQSLATLTNWASSFRPRSLWSPWIGEKHCDHLAASQLAGDLAGRVCGAPVLMDYLVWGWKEPNLCSGGEAVWALDCARNAGKRRRALACHRTQTSGLIADAQTAFQVPPELAALASRPVEIFLERP